MTGQRKLVGVEFGEMMEVLFEPAVLEGRVVTLQELKQKLHEITTSGAGAFEVLKKRKDIDRALPRLVVAATLTEQFGYSRLELTERELGTGLIIEAGMKDAMMLRHRSDAMMALVRAAGVVQRRALRKFLAGHLLEHLRHL